MKVVKQLVNEITGRKDSPIFDGSNEDIRKWVEDNINYLEFGTIEEEFDSSEYITQVSLDGDRIIILSNLNQWVFNIQTIEMVVV